MTDVLDDETGAGICTNPQCTGAARVEPVDRYPGPGLYCPDCGEQLSPYDPPSEPAASPEPARRVLPSRAIAVMLAAAVALVTLAALAFRVVPALTVRVCTTSMTDRAANELVTAYRRQNKTWPYRFTITRPDDLACDVRFYAVLNGPDATTIARDGVVAVVNPRNPLGRLSVGQLRNILAGRILNWGQIGGPPGTILALMPQAGSDEERAIASRVLIGSAPAARVVRTANAAQIVRVVASPSGLRALGIVPFSEALPAKVLALGRAPVPSTLSIAQGRYPLSMRLVAESDFRSPSRLAAALIAFARSPDAAKPLNRAQIAMPNGY